ncbi:CapA family protein [Aquicella lusitana]|uniref:Capsule synthesis protein PGA_cap n=1 Tax=Aquicella lusitana TaxID=254246 RepID=A0A370GYH2_9COXI|nr:CapA family protein [Aquicella lusitana]RDI48651.1 capsule synthesis protein PGA_cap [Aquicella lusitana]VVC73972.1 Capsule biosynthesis protein CapA [Aquicella lusitana]
MPSPYPWHYTLRWPMYFNWPSMRNHTAMQLVSDQYQDGIHEADDIRLLFCGDIMVQNKDRIPHLHPVLCQLIRSADLFIGNCEAPVGYHAPNARARYRFVFHMPRDYLANIIEQTGLPAHRWLLSMANNHTGDKDYEACLQPYDILTGMGVIPLGRFRADTPPLRIVQHKEWRLGFVAWTDWMNREIFPPHDPGAFRTQHILQHPWRCLKQKYRLDYLFGMPHWEYEFQHFPHRKTRALAKMLVDQLGMDFLVGIHTHTLQPMEWFERGFCAYSLGNFCGLGRAWSVKLIPLLEIRLRKVIGSHPLLAGYKMHYFFQQDQGAAVNIIPLEEASEAERSRLKQRLSRIFTMQGKEDGG